MLRLLTALFLTAFICVTSGCAPLGQTVHTRDELVVDLVVHVPDDAGTMTFTRNQIEAAREVFSSGNVRINVVTIVHDVTSGTELVTSSLDKDVRHLLNAAKADRRGVHVYIVDSVDGANTVGVNLRELTDRCRAIIAVQYEDGLLLQITGRTTLAHEIGHMFGLHLHHMLDISNVMKPGLRSLSPELRRGQFRTVRANIRRWKKRCGT